MKDDLNLLLRSWQPEVAEPPNFRRNVWQGIERLSSGQEETWLAGLFGLLARPRIALSAIALAVAIGSIVGLEISSENQTSAYLRSVNPYAQLR